MPVVINGDTGITQSGEFNSDSTMGFKNRVINGEMDIDQRNNGAALALTNNSGYPVDRFIAVAAATTTITFQQSSTAPAGFTRSLSATMTTPKSLAAADLNRIIHRFEGFNIADLGWGTASAQPVTLSFWARSSVTGIYTVQFGSGQSYLASYTINAANTWEYKTITVPGSTSGSWPTDNSAGAEINFVLGAGSSWLGTTGSWGSSVTFTVTGAANFIGTAGATFFITGVQLEKGSTATSFDFRSIGTELTLCQRYFEQINTADTGAGVFAVGYAYPTGSNARMFYQFMVPKRAQPTISSSAGSTFLIQQDATNLAVSNPVGAFALGLKTAWLNVSGVSGLATNASVLLINSGVGTAFLNFSAEL